MMFAVFSALRRAKLWKSNRFWGRQNESSAAAAAPRDSVAVAGGLAADGAGGFEGAETTVSLAQQAKTFHQWNKTLASWEEDSVLLVRLVDAQQQLEGLKEVISRLIDETYEKEGEIIKRGNQIEELEGRLQRIREHTQKLIDYLARTHGISREDILIHMKAWQIELLAVVGEGDTK